LDASSSSDPDIYQWDQLSYEWKFDWQTIKTENTYENNKKVVITATEPKPFVAKLIVKDKYGKASELSKTIEVKSSVRPTIDINPVASVWGNEITMTAKANKQVASYQWSFWDGNTKITNTPTVKHTYRKVWIYNVSLTVSTVWGETNTVYSRTFIGESNEPIVVYSVSRWNAWIIPTATCRINNADVPAFDIERYQSIKINAWESVNTKWDTSNLKVYFKPQNEEIYGWTTLEYKFSTLWCQFVDITVEDPIQGSVVKERAYFKVKNSIPKLDNLLISFPQYGNDVGIGFLQAKRNDPTFETMDPLIVKLVANGAIDPDGQISYYSRYYYKTDNPSRILDVKITPGTINSVTFGISREAWEYAFWVKIVDNNEEGKRSEEMIGQWPVIFLKPKWVDSNDIPIATLSTDKINAKVWEEITFKVTAKILSDRDDFIASRLFKYDFDGDGFDDLTTKLSEVKYSFTKPSSDSTPFQPKVKVVYRNKVWVSYAESIIIKKWIIPKFIYSVVGKTVLMQDVSIGWDSNAKTLICLDMKKCKTDSTYLKKDEKSFSFTYPENGKYVVKMEVKDQFENVEWYREIIDVNSDTTSKIATIPAMAWDKISVWKTLNNTVTLFADWDCSIDTDASVDINSDGNKTNDAEFKCWSIAKIDFSATSEWSKQITLFWTDFPTPKTINVELLDNLTLVPKEYEQNAAVIDWLMKEFEGKKDYAQLYETLSKLKSSLWDKAQTSAYLIDMRSLAMQSQLSSWSRTNIDKLIVELWGWAVSAVIGWSPYEQAKSEILKLVDSKTRTELTTTFQDLEANDWNKEKQATLLSSILQSVNTLAQQWDFDPNDITVIKAKLCEIASAKDIPTKTCTSENEQPTTGTVTTWSTEQPSDSTSTWFGWVVKIILIIVIVLVCAFILAVIFFAVRARMKQNQNTAPTPPAAA
jgi:PKD repeat protein